MGRVQESLGRILGVCLVAFQLYTAATIPFTAMLQRSIHLALGLALVFLLFPLKKGPKSLRYGVVDLTLCLLGLAGCLYVAVNWSAMAEPARLSNPTGIDVVLGTITFLLVLEATRRVVGPALPILSLVALGYLFLGPFVPPPFRHPGCNFRDLIAMGYMFTEGIFSSPLGASTSVVFAFILLGQFLESLGGGQFFLDTANSIVGSLRGGPAKVAIIGSGFFGTMSGSAVANVVGTGSVTIPLMKRVGYRSEFAGAVEAVASTGGLIMPPIMGAAAFIMAEVIGVPYIQIAAAAAIPAVLYYLGLYWAVDLRARRRNLAGVPKEEIPLLSSTMKQSGWVFLPPIGVLVVLLVVQAYSPAKAAFWSLVTLVILALTHPKARSALKCLLDVCFRASQASLPVITACACAGFVMVVLQTTGLGLKFSSVLVELSGGNLIALLALTMCASLVLGMGLPASACYIILAVLAAPALVELGVPVMAAHLFVMYFGSLSAITPPVCLAAYAASGISGASPMKIGFTAWRIALPIFLVAFCFGFRPELVLLGTPARIIASALLCAGATAAMALGLEGFFDKEIALWGRGSLVAGGALIIWPGLWSTLLGIGLVLAGLIPVLADELTVVKTALLKVGGLRQSR